MASSLTKRFKMSLTLSNKGNKKIIRCYHIAKMLHEVPSRLKQALAFPLKFQFLFNKVTFHFRMKFP